MIDHIVLFKFKIGTEKSAINKMAAQLAGLKHVIPEIISITCGENFSNRAQGFEQGLVVRFASRCDLQIYGEHPIHRSVVETYVKPILADILAVDFESGVN